MSPNYIADHILWWKDNCPGFVMKDLELDGIDFLRSGLGNTIQNYQTWKVNLLVPYQELEVVSVSLPA